MSVVRTAALIFLVCAGASFAQVRTWVSPAGVDSNPCTRDLPCRNFAAALALVSPGGEVVAMASGGYGPVTITKSVTLLAPAGVHAAVAPTADSAIIVDAGTAAGDVVLRNLYLNSQGASIGVDVFSMRSLLVEESVVHGFSGPGINTFGSGRLMVSRCVLRKNNGGAIGVLGGTATIDSVRLLSNSSGLVVSNGARVSIRNSVSGASEGVGLFASQSARLTIEDCVVNASNFGVFINTGSKATITRSVIAGSFFTGIRSMDPGTQVWLSDSTLSGNVLGVQASSSGEVYTRLNNTMTGNTNDGTFTASYDAD